MSLCRYNTSKPCENHGTSSRTCLDCVLDMIRAELEEMRPTVRHTDEYWQGISYGICYVLDEAIRIIDKYKAESEEV